MRSVQVLADAHNLGAYIANSMAAGRAAEAREAVAQLLNLHPDFRASHAQKVFPLRSPEMRDRLTAALRDAGLPD
jgi:adenylate cyclase